MKQGLPLFPYAEKRFGPCIVLLGLGYAKKWDGGVASLSRENLSKFPAVRAWPSFFDNRAKFTSSFHTARLNFTAHFTQSSLTPSRKMPSTTSDRKVQSRIKATNVARAARPSSESSDTSPERGQRNETGSLGPEDLDQPWPYEFKVTLNGPLGSSLNV
ncbi:hypothetical protein BDM02DRAFT_3125198 [Thelephora ganbajun]|uniref:Uncharacterized protein n=1 Tax=Thelephora ganbajun TaxID=370292 RepID=A0ACB6ZWX2_THEGA|nr:hypothetical protein BDM02DRAFT_3125198 [Thelephora ganbajun]